MSSRRECSVCWTVYDPAVGDVVRQVPPGTPFEALPDDWRCPTCDAEKSKFVRPEADEPPPLAESLLGAYRSIAARMAGLPILNPALKVELIGLRAHGDGHAGIVVTPWFMSIVYVPARAEPPRPSGTSVWREFPSGRIEFLTGHLEGVGSIESCSLFSPMDEFRDAAQAEAVAREAVVALFTTPAPEASVPPPPTRRELFRRVFAR